MEYNLKMTCMEKEVALMSIQDGSTSRSRLVGRDSIHSVENKILYMTEDEKCQFVWDSFKLNKNDILNADEKLTEAMIQLFDGSVTERNNLIPGLVPYKS